MLNLLSGVGRTIGAAGGFTQGLFGQNPISSGLRSLGGQLTGGSRTYNLAPALNTAYYAGPSAEAIKRGVSSASATTGVWPSSGGTSGGSSGGGNTNLVASSGDMSGGSVPTDDAFMQALNEYYSPAYSRLDALKQNYEQQLPISQQQVETSYNEALQPIEERLTKGTQQIQGQQTDVQQGKENAISQARRLYNELSQRGVTRFGAGSSAGPAYSEIVGQSTAQQIGGTENVAQKAFNDLGTDLRNLQDFVSKQKITLGEKKQTALDQVKADFDTKMREIEGQKGVLDQAKAQQKMDELISARQRAYDIEDAATSFQRQIDLFEKEKSYQLSQSYSVNTGISNQALTQFRNLMSSGLTPTQASQLTGVDLSQIQGTISPTNAWKDLGNGTYMNLTTGEVQYGSSGMSPADLSGSITGGNY